jgi:hypothetical protein
MILVPLSEENLHRIGIERTPTCFAFANHRLCRNSVIRAKIDLSAGSVRISYKASESLTGQEFLHQRFEKVADLIGVSPEDPENSDHDVRVANLTGVGRTIDDDSGGGDVAT